MTKNEIKSQIKATALNAIYKIYNSHNYDNGVGLQSHDWSESWCEQRDYKVKRIIEQLEKDLLKLKNKKEEK
jgi:hypothetical protein